MKSQTKRTYQMSKRAESAAQTERSIFSATAELWRERPFVDITLDTIAERAGVSVRTVIRRYGSKEGLFEAAIQNDAADIKTDREKAEPDDIEAALRYLLTDYEAYGDAAVRTLSVEDHIEAARKMLQAGRAYHRDWCARIFASHLPDKISDDYEEGLRSFIAATELYLWKLLRRDLGHSEEETYQTFLNLVTALIKQNQNK